MTSEWISDSITRVLDSWGMSKNVVAFLHDNENKVNKAGAFSGCPKLPTRPCMHAGDLLVASGKFDTDVVSIGCTVHRTEIDVKEAMRGNLAVRTFIDAAHNLVVRFRRSSRLSGALLDAQGNEQVALWMDAVLCTIPDSAAPSGGGSRT